MSIFNVDKNTAYLITDRVNRLYFTGVDVSEGVVAVSNSGTTYFLDARYLFEYVDALSVNGVKAVLYSGIEDIANYLKESGVKKILADYSVMTVSEFNEYKELGLKVENGQEFLSTARAIKTPSEIESLKKACSIIQKVYYQGIKALKKGVTERQMQALFENLMVELGSEGPSFETIVAFGANSAIPHHQSGDTVLEDNMVVLVDMGCKVNGYCSDITRTAFFGTPDKKFLESYSSVLNANLTAIENITENTFFSVADGYARRLLEEKGLAKYFTHSLGHGVGLKIHEYPTLSPKKQGKLKNGMAFTIEPGVYFNGEFGIRIEDTVILVDGRVERLYTDDKQLLIL